MFEVPNDLSSYLAPNERVLWEGRGKRKLASVQLLLAFIPVVVVIALFGFTFLMSSSYGGYIGGARIIVPLILLTGGLIFVILFTSTTRQTSNVRYLVTTLSAMIISRSAWSGKRVTLVALKNAPQITFTENRDGTGTIMFGSNPYMAYGRTYSSWYADATPAFWNIERPLEVYHLIRKTMINPQ